jgi:hypothetical protein
LTTQGGPLRWHVDTGGKVTAGVVHTGGQFTAGIVNKQAANLPPASLTQRRKNLPLVSLTTVVTTFPLTQNAVTPAANYPPVSTTPAVNVLPVSTKQLEFSPVQWSTLTHTNKHSNYFNKPNSRRCHNCLRSDIGWQCVLRLQFAQFFG